MITPQNDDNPAHISQDNASNISATNKSSNGKSEKGDEVASAAVKEYYKGSDVLTPQKHDKIDVLNYNIIPAPNSDQLYVSYDNNTKAFMFYRNNNVLGSFTIRQLLKSVVMDPAYNESVTMNQVNTDIINSMIVTSSYDSNKHIHIDLRSQFESPYMGNIQTLVQLNTLLFDYDRNELEHDIAGLDGRKQKNVRNIIKQYIYMMINHTMKIVSIISEQIKADPMRELLKQKLLRYASYLNYKSNIYIRGQIQTLSAAMYELNDKINRLATIKQTPQSTPATQPQSRPSQQSIAISQGGTKQMKHDDNDNGFAKYFADDNDDNHYDDGNNDDHEFSPIKL